MVVRGLTRQRRWEKRMFVPVFSITVLIVLLHTICWLYGDVPYEAWGSMSRSQIPRHLILGVRGHQCALEGRHH